MYQQGLHLIISPFGSLIIQDYELKKTPNRWATFFYHEARGLMTMRDILRLSSLTLKVPIKNISSNSGEYESQTSLELTGKNKKRFKVESQFKL